jgi:ubiquinol-cytochrome c reductase iron-sulfur subunit
VNRRGICPVQGPIRESQRGSAMARCNGPAQWAGNEDEGWVVMTDGTVADGPLADDAVDQGKRRFLIVATSVVGGIGVVSTATPFVMSLFPSERAKAAGAPVEVDVGKLEPGQKIDVEWRGKVVWLVNRTPSMLDSLPKLDPKLADPASNSSLQPADCKNEHRSIKDAMWVAIGICTHLGCSPTYRPEVGPADLGPEWLGGFFCPCHQSKFDLAGRVFKGVPAPTNLTIPPHKYLSDARIRIGEDTKA